MELSEEGDSFLCQDGLGGSIDLGYVRLKSEDIGEETYVSKDDDTLGVRYVGIHL